MKETSRMLKLFKDLYDGDPWVGVNILSTLNNVSARQAARKLFPDWNSIWEITNHLANWRQNVLLRVQGETVNAPDNNYFEPITDFSETAWNNSLQKLKDSQQRWNKLLSRFRESDLERIYPNNNMTYYENIHGILQHDAYHLGQIVLLAKAV